MKLEIKQDVAEEVLRGKFTVMNAHTKTQEKILTDNERNQNAN